MRTILAIAALFAVGACQSGGGYGPPPAYDPVAASILMGGGPFRVWTPPPARQAPAYEPPAYTYRPPLNCTSYRVGNTVSTNCY